MSSKKSEINKLTNLIKSCYKKFKSYIYYSNNLTHAKYKIIKFERQNNFESTFEEIAKALTDKNREYFDKLINKIDWIPQIKRIKNKSIDNKDIVSNIKNNENVIVEAINYFIDMPLELYILDTFWTILFGKSLHDNKNINEYVKANEFAYELYSDEVGIEGINFKSLEIYKPYFKNYQKWKNGAINTVSTLYDQKRDSSILSLDLSGYFYSVDIDFKSIYTLSSFADYDFSFETSILENIHKCYWNKLRKVKPSIKNHKVLPIGLISSCVLANYYLRKFDITIASNENVKYYSRYVDDILIVMPIIEKDLEIIDFLKKYFDDVFGFENDYIYIKNKPLCKLQSSKIKVIQNYKDSSKSLIESLKDEIANPSEANLLPNIENTNLDNFLLEIYSKKIESLKIRDNEGLELSKYKLMRFMSAHVISRKNTIFKDGKKNKYDKLDEKTYKQLEILFDNYNLFYLWDRWGKIFEFTYLNNSSFSLTESLINKINSNIELIAIEDSDVYPNQKESLTKRLQKFLRENLVYSLGAVLSLRKCNENTNNKIVKRANKNISKIRNANLLNHNLVGIPLANYLPQYRCSTKDIYNVQESDLLKDNSELKFDSRKLEYSPRFIHLGEYMLCCNLLSITKLNDSKFAANWIQKYKNDFDIKQDFFDISSNEKFDDKYILSNVKCNYKYDEKTLTNIYIALGNINLNKHGLIKGNKINLDGYKNVENKMVLFKLLNDCVWIEKNEIDFGSGESRRRLRFKDNKHVDFLAFPELYVPFEWLNYILDFSRKNGICVITGVKYCKCEEKLVNSIATIIPFKDENGYKYSAIFMREKNDYAPDEIELIKESGFDDPTKEISFNYIFEWNSIKFSALNCFELTDIKARSILKSNVDIIFAPEYNRDISYFSNIIESTSRDDGCFVVQINSSNIGDTRIVGPFSPNYANICSISGGEKDLIHIGNINIQEYRDYKEYEKSDVFTEDLKVKYNKLKKSKRKTDFSKYKKSSAKL